VQGLLNGRALQEQPGPERARQACQSPHHSDGICGFRVLLDVLLESIRVAAPQEKPKVDIMGALVNTVLKNPFIWGMALTYFFIYVVRQVPTPYRRICRSISV
jgi:hypothetical protein